jgi:hypothetical protein
MVTEQGRLRLVHGLLDPVPAEPLQQELEVDT